jgi:DNA-binding transcriptional MerR regulator
MIMRKMLQIGEVAQLLGVTSKTIRHYHKIGLLPEPERTESGYRLYNAQDLLRLKQIRHMQEFGLSLKHIKTILGDPAREHTLREILQVLDTELASQIQVLEERRARIHTILDEGALIKIDQPATIAGFEIVKELIDERMALTINPAMLEMEKQLWMVLDEFDWPLDYREHMLQLARDLASRPELYERMFAFNAKLASLSTLPEDAPEVDHLVEEYVHNKHLQATLAEIKTLLVHLPPLESPFAEMFGNLISVNISPAQQRFMTEVERWHASIDPASKR